MYEQADNSINAGLSFGARIILALFAASFGVVMIIIASPESGAKAAFFYGFGIFCLAVAASCVTRGRVRQFIGSVIGTAIFVAGVCYLASELRSGVLWSSRRSDPSAYNAVLYLLFIGFPGAVYAYRAGFGFRRKP